MSKVVFKNVRCSYVYVTSPRKNEDGSDGKYSVQIILDKSHPQLNEIKKAIKAAAIDKFGAKIKMGMLKLPLRDGDEEREDEEYEGAFFVNVNGGRKPGILNRKKQPADVDDINEYCYSGAYFNVSVNFYGFEKEGNRGVAAGLNNIMLLRKGDRLDGSSTAGQDFADMAAEEDDDDDLDGDDWD